MRIFFGLLFFPILLAACKKEVIRTRVTVPAPAIQKEIVTPDNVSATEKKVQTILVSPTPSALEFKPPPVVSPCNEDFKKYCNYDPFNPRPKPIDKKHIQKRHETNLESCIKKNLISFSEACRNIVRQQQEKTAACSEDTKKLCGSLVGRAKYLCLKQNQSQLSNECKKHF